MLLLEALQGVRHGRPPIWLMRQAGRYLPAYRALKGSRPLWELFHNQAAIVEITLLPLSLLNLDAAILFSDILTLCDGLGIGYTFEETQGPRLLDPPSALTLTLSDAPYTPVLEAIRTLKQTLTVPLIGFAGGPFTLAAYLIEGGASRECKKTKQWLYRDPVGFSRLIDQITEATISYLGHQVRAGVDVIQLFDSSAHVLGHREFSRYVLAPMRKILATLSVPSLLFCRGSSLFAPALAALKPSGISVDWLGALPDIRAQIGTGIALQGNLDPMALYGTPAQIQEAVDPLLEGMRGDPSYIFNLGHGILPDIPFENVRFLVDYVRAYT